MDQRQKCTPPHPYPPLHITKSSDGTINHGKPILQHFCITCTGLIIYQLFQPLSQGSLLPVPTEQEREREG